MQSFVQYVPQTAESTVHAAAVVLAQPLTVASIARWASIANEVTCASTNLKSGGMSTGKMSGQGYWTEGPKHVRILLERRVAPFVITLFAL